jgi:hypothetical protein
MRFGNHNGYQIFDWPQGSGVKLREIWRTFPELALGRFMVNTSFDSGHFMPSTTALAEGWHVVGQLAHSPRITAIDEIPKDQFDEWLIFDSPVQVPAFETLVNFCDFTPLDFDFEGTTERGFWEQVAELQPLHLVGENYGAYLITRDGDLGERIKESQIIGSIQPP